jgi:hypothetical protein
VSGFATGPDRDVFERSRFLPGALNGMVRWLQDWRFSFAAGYRLAERFRTGLVLPLDVALAPFGFCGSDPGVEAVC